eukprot:GGOE01037085.1.p1 GENE.GGOE01037085.1~~GGOE01037085.1.p1  ORF type:complete len:173 (+),score=53.32 GGOE01037085.1:143-661(+)
MFAAAVGVGRVVLTDLPAVLAVLQENVQLNASCWAGRQPPAVVEVQPLRWGTDDHDALQAVDLVLVADCVYWEELFAPLVATLRHFTAQGALVLMAHVRRWTRDNRFFRLAARQMQLQVVQQQVGQDEDGRRQVQTLYCLTRQGQRGLPVIPQPDPPAMTERPPGSVLADGS